MSDNQRTDDPERTPASLDAHRSVGRAIAVAGKFRSAPTGVVHTYRTYAWLDDGRVGQITAACGWTAALAAPAGMAVEHRAQVTTGEVTCSACLGTPRDVTVTSPPRLEVLVERDPDGGTDVTLFVDGVRTEYDGEVVDPGYGHMRSEWDEHTKDVPTLGYSEAFTAAVLEARAQWSDSKYIEDDDVEDDIEY
jgi:hypothetical protein